MMISITLIIVEAYYFNSAKVISLIDFKIVNSLSFNTAVFRSMSYSDEFVIILEFMFFLNINSILIFKHAE